MSLARVGLWYRYPDINHEMEHWLIYKDEEITFRGCIHAFELRNRIDNIHREYKSTILRVSTSVPGGVGL